MNGQAPPGGLANLNGVVLTGLPGSGKSTIGSILAQRLGFSFVDTDTLIEQDAQATITEIFARSGEAYFRQLETKALEILAMRKNARMVVSVGGGAPESQLNRTLMRQIGVVIYLRTPIDQLIARLGSDTSRPLLQTPPAGQERPFPEKTQPISVELPKTKPISVELSEDRGAAAGRAPDNRHKVLRQKLEMLLGKRSGAYEEADIIVDTELLTLEEVVTRIEEALNTGSRNVY